VRLAVLATAVCLVAGCRNPGAEQSSSQDRYRAALNQIADQCHLARSTFKLVSDDELMLQFDSNVRVENMDCGLAKLKEAKLPLKLGFVGNEYYVGNEQ
jgi:hypothetical protein